MSGDSGHHVSVSDGVYIENLKMIKKEILGSASQDSANPLKSAAILYANVKGYSILNPADQTKAMNLARTEIEAFLNHFDGKLGENCWLEFRGGDLLVLIGSLTRAMTEPEEIILAFLLGLRLQVGAASQSIRIGVTVDIEFETRLFELYGQKYITGKSIDEAPMLMSFSHSDHYFVSNRAYQLTQEFLDHITAGAVDGLFDGRFAVLSQKGREWLTAAAAILKQHLPCDGEFFVFHDQHKRPHHIYNFHSKAAGAGLLVGNLEHPYHSVAVEFRVAASSPANPFLERLILSDRVTIIGLTHETLVKNFLEPALHERRRMNAGFWKELRVVFPSLAVLDKVVEIHRTRETRRELWELGRKNVYQFLLGQNSENWECLEFDGNLPFIGNLFYSQDDARVRVAPVLPGQDLRNIYYTEFFQGMPAFDQVSSAVNIICNNSVSMVEWDVYGRASEKDMLFYYDALANRRYLYKVLQERRKNRRPNRAGPAGMPVCTPVVLIMLYADMGGERRSILQRRTIYNASNDFDTYSNISGRITAVDVLNALGLKKTLSFSHQVSLDDNGSMATNEFNKISRMTRYSELPPETWKHGARREVWEELGLHIDDLDRFEYQASHYLEREDGDIFFTLFSLKLCLSAECNELAIINANRPYANLENFCEYDLADLHHNNKLNRLLQKRFKELFVPIFDQLGIE